MKSRISFPVAVSIRIRFRCGGVLMSFDCFGFGLSFWFLFPSIAYYLECHLYKV